MARSFLAGMIWGTAISGLGLAGLMLYSGPPDGPARQGAEDAAVNRAVQQDGVLPGADPETAPDTVPEPVQAPDTPEPADAPDPEEDAEPVAAAEPAADATPPVTPDNSQPGRRPQPETAIDRPAAPDPAPAAPSGPDAVGADTAPPSPPDVGEAPQAPDSGSPEPAESSIAVTGDTPVSPGAQPAAPDAPSPETRPLIASDPAQPPTPAVPGGQSALAENAPDPTESPDPTAPAPEVPEAPAPGSDRPTAEAAEALETPEPVVPPVGRPATSLFDRAAAVPEDPEPVVPEDGTETAQPIMPPDSPIMRFAADVVAPEGVPRMAVVLIDDGSGPLGPSGLKAFPFPVSFAIPPSHPDAAGAAAGYRDLGFEVMVLGAMPEGAQPTDVEVAMAGLIDAVPEAVGMLEDPTGSLQENREISTQIAAYLSASGHGLVMQPNGLNTAQKLALRDGVPAVTLFRDFDGEGQDAALIRRTLDQAAFRARQEGGVVMMGRLRADTVSALVLWGLQDRSGEIALVPVSTVLIETLADAQ